MNNFEFSVSLFGLTAAALVVNSVNLKAFAAEIPTEVVNQQTNTQIQIQQELGNISYSAADLVPAHDSFDDSVIAQRRVEPAKFCKDYPYNSACIDQKSEEKTEGEVEFTQPFEEETKKAKTSGWAVTPEIGTTGIGASVTKSVSDNVNARVGLNAFTYGADFEEEDVEYEADLNLFNVSTVVDYHPWKKSGFRLTGGLVFNNNNVSGNGKPNDNQEFEYNGNTYTSDQIRSVDAKISLPNKVAPYLGIGWGNAVKPGNRFAFSLNLGVMFTGSPQVDLSADIDPSVPNDIRQDIQDDIEAERKEIEDDINGFGVYPVLSIGASYHF
ncbi:MAG: hypothetical protein WBA39_14655 [Rivularia sp. (in: cyanobacteria)]